MVLEQKRVAIGRFSHRSDMEHTFDELKKAGFLIAQISIVAKYADFKIQVDSSEAEDDAAIVMVVGSMLGAIIGCLTGLGVLAIPGVGLIVTVGNAGTAAVTTLAGTGFGLLSGGLISAITGGLNQVSGDDREQDEFLMIVDGTDEEVSWAKSILSKSHSHKIWVCSKV